MNWLEAKLDWLNFNEAKTCQSRRKNSGKVWENAVSLQFLGGIVYASMHIISFFLLKCEKLQSLLGRRCLALKGGLFNQSGNKYFKIQNSLFLAGQIKLLLRFIWPAWKSEVWILKYLFSWLIKESRFSAKHFRLSKDCHFSHFNKKRYHVFWNYYLLINQIIKTSMFSKWKIHILWQILS